jgi:exopolysaccharide production protein ExoQ
MGPVRLIAAAFCGLVIWQLFRLNREEKIPTSVALWIPTLWIFIGATRNLSVWFNFSSGGGERYTEGNLLDQIAAVAMLAIGLFVLLKRSRRVTELLRTNLPVIFFFLYCGVSVIWSDYPDVSFKRWLRAIGDIVMVLIVLSDVNWLTALRRVLTRVGFIAIPLSILFIRYFPELGRAYSRGGASSWSGVAGGKNGLGMICLVFGLASLARFLAVYREERSSQRTRILLAQSSLLAMTIYLLLKANSATSFACFFMCATPMILISFFPLARKPVFLHLMVSGIIGVAFCALFLNIGTGMVQDLGRDSTLTGRTDIWRSAFTQVQNPLIGSGYESFWIGPRLEAVQRLINQFANQAHNGYIEIYLNLGWIGDTLLAVLLIAAYGRVVKAVGSMAPTAALGLAFFIANVAYNFTEAAFKMMHPLWISLFLLTMIKPESLATENSAPTPIPPFKSKQIAEPKLELAPAGRRR